MPDFLTRRNGTWHFARRVPVEYAELDRRGVIKHSTRIKIASDRAGRKAARVAETYNLELERHWVSLARGTSANGISSYETARLRARSMGFEYFENELLLSQPVEARLLRLEALASNGVVNDRGARAALLGMVKKPIIKLSQILQEYEEIEQVRLSKKSPDQLRIWRTTRKCAIETFCEVVGDKSAAELTVDDALDYNEWWRDRVLSEEVNAQTANKRIGQLGRMLKDISVRRRLGLPDLFSGLRIRGGEERSRLPFETSFIQNQLLAPGALEGLNEDARLVVYVMVETGLRPSEIVNLKPKAILLDAEIPHLKIQPDGRQLKTVQSEREMPLLGAALAAMRKRPEGFPRYEDKSSSLSATVGKYLKENSLRPTKQHTLYSLRHSFKDRLVAVEAPVNVIDALMGHKVDGPRYGNGPPLEQKLKWLQRIALRAPASL